MKNIGVTLKALRVERGYTLRQLAEIAQMPFSHLSNIENGKTLPGLDVIDRVCTALGVPLRDVIIKADLDREVKANQQKLFKELMPYFRKIDAVAKRIYNSGNDNPDERDDEWGENGAGLKPIIGGAGASKEE